MTGQNRKKLKKSFLIKLFLTPIVMFAFAYALVPIYDVLCEITGFNGRTIRITVEDNYIIDENRKVNVSFFASTSAGFPIIFYPKQKSMEVIPGKFYTTSYIAKNNTDKSITGQAIPSVAPTDAALYFKKIECFCFTNQVFKAREEVEMSLRFVIDPQMNKNIHDVSLSYNFFNINR